MPRRSAVARAELQPAVFCKSVPAYSRPSTGHPIVGTAVPKGSVPPSGGGTVIVVPGPGYYPGYYYPWWFGAGAFAGGYGYYAGYYDPWYGIDPGYGYGFGGGSYGGDYGGGDSSDQSSSSSEEGSLHLKIKPRDAQVFVDGYYVGVVDDFDGIFQKLHIGAGSHRVEVRAPGYESMIFDVHIGAGQGTTYQGELKRIQ